MFFAASQFHPFDLENDVKVEFLAAQLLADL
jgi:hypothetical protein